MIKYISTLLLILSFSSLAPAANVAGAGSTDMLVHAHYAKAGIAEEAIVSTKGSSETAKKIIYAIVQSVGLKPNFEIRQANISNAAAVNHKGRRYILYDANFMNSIQQATQTDWAAVSILAHEIGHHLNGHTLMGKSHNNAALELEADEFSGFVLRQMGASLEDAQKALRLMVGERGSATHPGRSARMAAIEKGYTLADERILSFTDQKISKTVNL